MSNVLFLELGFPVLLVNARMVEVQGQRVPDVNLRHLQEAAFSSLVKKPGRLSGSEVRFIRKYLRMRQTDLAKVLNMANHSVVSHGSPVATSRRAWTTTPRWSCASGWLHAPGLPTGFWT